MEFNSYADIRQFMSDQPLENPHLYVEDFVERATDILEYHRINAGMDWKEFNQWFQSIGTEDFWLLFDELTINK